MLIHSSVWSSAASGNYIHTFLHIHTYIHTYIRIQIMSRSKVYYGATQHLGKVYTHIPTPTYIHTYIHTHPEQVKGLLWCDTAFEYHNKVYTHNIYIYIYIHTHIQYACIYKV